MKWLITSAVVAISGIFAVHHVAPVVPQPTTDPRSSTIKQRGVSEPQLRNESVAVQVETKSNPVINKQPPVSSSTTNPPSAPVSSTAQSSNSSQQNNSQIIKAFIANGQPFTCTFNNGTSKVVGKGALYVAEGKVAEDTTISIKINTIEIHQLEVNNIQYTWSEPRGGAYKKLIDAHSSLLSENSLHASDTDSLNLQCRPWVEDQAILTLPSDISFQQIHTAGEICTAGNGSITRIPQQVYVVDLYNSASTSVQTSTQPYPLSRRTPTVTGVASGTSIISLAIFNNHDQIYASGDAQVANGRWSVGIPPSALSSITGDPWYELEVYDSCGNKIDEITAFLTQ